MNSSLNLAPSFREVVIQWKITIHSQKRKPYYKALRAVSAHFLLQFPFKNSFECPVFGPKNSKPVPRGTRKALRRKASRAFFRSKSVPNHQQSLDIFDIISKFIHRSLYLAHLRVHILFARMGTKSYPVIDMAATGRNILRLRVARGLSVSEVREFFGFDAPQAIYKWQQGKSVPCTDNLLALSHLLEVPMDEILVPQKSTFQILPQEESCGSHFLELLSSVMMQKTPARSPGRGCSFIRFYDTFNLTRFIDRRCHHR